MTSVRRAPVVDDYVEDGRAAVYSDEGVVLVLSELATQMWLVLSDEWTSVGAVAEELIRQFGPPTGVDVIGATRTALRSLAEHGLVEEQG